MVINILYTPGEKIFKLNGKTYVRNFHAYVAGDKIRIVNAYDTRDELLPYTKFDLISFNGNSYNSALELMASIAEPLFRKLGDSSGGVSVPFDNNITVLEKSVYINWSAAGSRDGKVAQKLSNSAPFTVNGNQFVLIYTYKNFTMYQAQNYNPEIHLWIFKPGKGTYGHNETPVQVKDIRYIGYTRGNYENVEYDLGEIGELPISLYINEADESYTTNQDVYNIFKCTREGNEFAYVFIGSDKYLIGNIDDEPEANEVFESEFNLLTGETLYPQSEQGFIPYDYHFYKVTDLITNATFDPQHNFYVVEADDQSPATYYFAIKNSLAAKFQDSRIYIEKLSGDNFDLTTIHSTVDGYTIYELGDFLNSELDFVQLPFNVWSFGGGGTGSGNTNLGYNPSPTQGTVTSDTGNDATIPLAGSGNAGLMTSEEKDKIATALQQSDLTNYYTRTESNNMFEAIGNKITDFAANIASNQFYPTVKAVYDWATGLFTQKGNYNGTAEDLKNQIDLIIPKIVTPPASGTLSIDLTAYKVCYDSPTDLTNINIAAGSLLGAEAYLPFNGATYPTITGAVEQVSDSIPQIDFQANEDYVFIFEKDGTGQINWMMRKRSV